MRIYATFSQPADGWCLCQYVLFIDFGNNVVLCAAHPLPWKLFCVAGELNEEQEIKITLNRLLTIAVIRVASVSAGCWIIEIIIMIRRLLTTKTTHR